MVSHTTTSPGNLETDDESLDKNSEGKARIRPDYESNNISTPVAENALAIIELRANTGTTPTDHDSLVIETFSDADGYNNYVNTGNTDATFDTNKYKRVQTNVDEAHGVTLDQTDTSDQARSGVKIHCNIDCEVVGADRVSGCTGGSLKLYASDGTTELASASAVGDTFTFASPVALSAGNDYYLGIDNAGGWTRKYKAGSYPYSNTYTNFTAGWIEGTGDDSNIHNIKSVNINGVEDNILEIDLPTISGTIVYHQLIINDPDRETGDDIKYNIVDTDSNADNDLDVDTKNSLTNVDGSKITGGKLQIQLIAKASSPTNGKPSIRSFALKLWKA